MLIPWGSWQCRKARLCADPLLRCEVDSITHEIILSFLGRVQLEVVSALLAEKYKIES